MRQLIGCICDEMKGKACIGAALTFKCPKHGQITVDMRALPYPLTFPPMSIPNPVNVPNPFTFPNDSIPYGGFYPNTIPSLPLNDHITVCNSDNGSAQGYSGAPFISTDDLRK